jgi:hypothetical protein
MPFSQLVADAVELEADETVAGGPDPGGDLVRLEIGRHAARRLSRFDAVDHALEEPDGDLDRLGGRDEPGDAGPEHHPVVGGVGEGELPVGVGDGDDVDLRVVGDGDRFELGDEASVAVGVELVDDAVLAAEAGVDVHRAHAGFVGDPAHGERLGADGRQQVVGGRQQCVARFVLGSIHLGLPTGSAPAARMPRALVATVSLFSAECRSIT